MFNAAGRFWSIAVGLLLTPYIISRVGLELYGVWAFGVVIFFLSGAAGAFQAVQTGLQRMDITNAISAAAYLNGRSPSAVHADGALGNSLGYYLRDMHKEPYYRRSAAPGSFIRSSAGLSALPPDTCLALELNESSAAAPLSLKKGAVEFFAAPGGPRIYCVKKAG